MKGQVKTGSVTMAGAAYNVELGFLPKHVILFNRANATRGEWIDSMPDAAMIKTVTAGTTTYATSNGVTPYAGSAGSASKGFTIGADAQLAAAGTLDYIAFGDD